MERDKVKKVCLYVVVNGKFSPLERKDVVWILNKRETRIYDAYYDEDTRHLIWVQRKPE